jgi:flagellar basal-body rod modification protein FlgD
MAVNSVQSNPGGLGQTGRPGARVNSQEFMQLLTTQLKNQNPFDPVADTEFLAQLAQFSQLEETQAQRGDIADLASTMKSNTSLQGLSQASNLIGKQISYLENDGTEATGKVEGVRFTSAGIQLAVGEKFVPLGNITSVSAEAE